MKYLFLITILLIACTPQQRLNRLVTKHPELIKQDTLIIKDTLIKPGFEFDTLAPLLIYDTVFIDKFKTEVKVIRLKGDTVKVSIKQDPDTVYREKPVVVPKIIIQKPDWLTWVENHKWWFIIFGALLLILLIYRILFK